jgi:hypothetical protein
MMVSPDAIRLKCRRSYRLPGPGGKLLGVV